MRIKTGSAVLEIKEIAETGLFSGYGAVFGNKDSHGDVIEKGAFKSSLNSHKQRGFRPKMFWQHDMREPIGSWLSAKEDDHGLLMEGRLNMNVQRGREAYELLKAEDIDGLSIGYRTLKDEQDDQEGVRRLKELDLVEVSVVSLGSNELAVVGDVKRIRGDDLPSLPEFESFLREVGGFSKSEAAAICNRGLSHLLRGEPGSEPSADDLAKAFAALDLK